jgi:hypothetical protein
MEAHMSTMRNILAAGAAAAALTLALTHAASAADLPTYIEGNVQADTVTQGTGGSSVVVPDGATATGNWTASDGVANASASISGAPVVFLTAGGDASAGGTATAYASIFYFITVNGPTSFIDYVPIDFVANLATSEFASLAYTGADGDPRAIADAGFSLGGDIYSTGPTSFESRACNAACQWGNFAQGAYVGGYGDPSLTYAISGVAGLQIGRTGVVSETVSIDAVVGSSSYFAGQSANASASADPYFFIDPAFLLDHPGFSLTISPGVENNPLDGGVPEPASWALMLTGVGALGIALRRRRANALLLRRA